MVPVSLHPAYLCKICFKSKSTEHLSNVISEVMLYPNVVNKDIQSLSSFLHRPFSVFHCVSRYWRKKLLKLWISLAFYRQGISEGFALECYIIVVGINEFPQYCNAILQIFFKYFKYFQYYKYFTNSENCLHFFCFEKLRSTVEREGHS